MRPADLEAVPTGLLLGEALRPSFPARWRALCGGGGGSGGCGVSSSGSGAKSAIANMPLMPLRSPRATRCDGQRTNWEKLERQWGQVDVGHHLAALESDPRKTAPSTAQPAAPAVVPSRRVRFFCPETPAMRTKRTRRADNAAHAVEAGWRSLRESSQAIDTRIEASVNAIDALLSVMAIGVGHEYVPPPSCVSYTQVQPLVAQQQQQPKYYMHELGRAGLDDDRPSHEPVMDGPARLSAVLEAVAEFAASHAREAVAIRTPAVITGGATACGGGERGRCSLACMVMATEAQAWCAPVPTHRFSALNELTRATALPLHFASVGPVPLPTPEVAWLEPTSEMEGSAMPMLQPIMRPAAAPHAVPQIVDMDVLRAAFSRWVDVCVARSHTRLAKAAVANAQYSRTLRALFRRLSRLKRESLLSWFYHRRIAGLYLLRAFRCWAGRVWTEDGRRGRDRCSSSPGRGARPVSMSSFWHARRVRRLPWYGGPRQGPVSLFDADSGTLALRRGPARQRLPTRLRQTTEAPQAFEGSEAPIRASAGTSAPSSPEHVLEHGYRQKTRTFICFDAPTGDRGDGDDVAWAASHAMLSSFAQYMSASAAVCARAWTFPVPSQQFKYAARAVRATFTAVGFHSFHEVSVVCSGTSVDALFEASPEWWEEGARIDNQMVAARQSRCLDAVPKIAAECYVRPNSAGVVCMVPSLDLKLLNTPAG